MVSVDGRSATLRPLQGKGFSYTLTDVETIEVETGAYFSNTYQTYSLADFIESQDMAEQAIAAGGGWRWNASQPLGSATELTYSFVTQAPTARERSRTTPRPRTTSGRTKAEKPKNWSAASAKEAPTRPAQFPGRASGSATDEKSDGSAGS